MKQLRSKTADYSKQTTTFVAGRVDLNTNLIERQHILQLKKATLE